jgi:hypothetical protein
MTGGSDPGEHVRILRDCQLNPPAAAGVVDECEQALGVALPNTYKRFLQFAKGGEAV